MLTLRAMFGPMAMQTSLVWAAVWVMLMSKTYGELAPLLPWAASLAAALRKGGWQVSDP